jgi:hypothetical protein
MTSTGLWVTVRCISEECGKGDGRPRVLMEYLADGSTQATLVRTRCKRCGQMNDIRVGGW